MELAPKAHGNGRISWSNDVASSSIRLDSARNVLSCSGSTLCKSLKPNARTVFSKCLKQASTRDSLLTAGCPSKRSAIASSVFASSSSNSRWASLIVSGKWKPGSRMRYFHNAMRVMKSTRSCICHCWMRSRNSRFCSREGQNSRRTPSARALTLSRLLLIVSRRARLCLTAIARSSENGYLANWASSRRLEMNVLFISTAAGAPHN